jgi:hypothetical protein
MRLKMEITQELVVQIVGYIIVAAIVVRYAIEALRVNKSIEDVNAGKINQFLSFVAASGVFALQYFGFIDTADAAVALGGQLAASLITWPVIAILAWLLHQAIRIIEGRLGGKEEESPKALTPSPVR